MCFLENNMDKLGQICMKDDKLKLNIYLVDNGLELDSDYEV